MLYFQSLCVYILEHESEFTDGEKVKLRAQFKDYYNEVTNKSITPEDYTLWKYATFPEMAQILNTYQVKQMYYQTIQISCISNRRFNRIYRY